MRLTTREETVGRNLLQTGDAMCAPQLSSVLFRSVKINMGGCWLNSQMFSGSCDWKDKTDDEDSLQESTSRGWFFTSKFFRLQRSDFSYWL